MTVVPTYRRNGWSRHTDVDQKVCFPEARDPVTGAYISRREKIRIRPTKKGWLTFALRSRRRDE